MINVFDVNIKLFNVILDKVDKFIDKEKYDFSFNINPSYDSDLILLIYLKNKMMTPDYILKFQDLSCALILTAVKNDNKLNKTYSIYFQFDYKNENKSINEKLLNKSLNRLETFFKNE